MKSKSNFENYSDLNLEEKLHSFLAEIDFRDLPENKTKQTQSAFNWDIEIMRPKPKFYEPIINKLFEKDFIFSEEKKEEIIATIFELLINSICECNQSHNLDIEVKIYYGEKGIVIHIIDSGEGFNLEENLQKDRSHLTRESVVNINNTPSEGKLGGCGLYCLEKFADEYSYNQKGNEVIIKFELRSFER